MPAKPWLILIVLQYWFKHAQLQGLSNTNVLQSVCQGSWQRHLRARKVGMRRSLKLNLSMNWWHDLSYRIASTSEIQCLPQPIEHHFQPCQKTWGSDLNSTCWLSVRWTFNFCLWLQYPLNKLTSKERCAFLHIFQGPCSESHCQLKGSEAGP